MGKVTIEDISRHTGLSRGTVSRALNDRPDISAQTKQKVLEACSKLNYVPSHAARSLATGRSLAAAVFVDDLDRGFSISFVRGILKRAQQARYAIYVGEFGGGGELRPADTIRNMVNERIDFVVLGSSVGEEETGILREVLETRPLVGTSHLDGIGADVYMPDQLEGGRLVARHLLRNGNREILYIHIPGTINDQRLSGFEEVCREHGIDPGSVTLTLHEGLPLSANMMSSLRDRISAARAIGTSEDGLALQVMLLCSHMGRVIGRDVAVVGQGNERWASQLTPTLSSVDFSGFEIGQRALDTALQRVNKTRMDSPQTTRVTPVLIERESSGCGE